ncbi:MAG TPA: hypothetical protein VH540_16545 [Ktedonobacterales bacterium]|jgi:hypothetical protein
MAVSIIPLHDVKKGRKIALGGVAGVLALVFLAFGAPALLAPWKIVPLAISPASVTYTPELHRWHDAVGGTLASIVLAGTLLGLVWQGQRRLVLAQFFTLSALIFALTMLLFAFTRPMNYLFPAVILAVFLLAYPAPRELLTFKREELSLPLLALSAVVLLALAPNIWQNVELQLTDKASEHAQNLHWISTALLEGLLLLAGFLAALKRPGWRMLSGITGIALVYLGAAAQTVPTHPGSWGTIGGALALLGGLAYLVITMLEKQSQASQQEQPQVPAQKVGVGV